MHDLYTVTPSYRGPETGKYVLRDIVTAVTSNMGIALDQYDVIHKDVNEQWDQPPKVEVDKFNC